MENFENYLASIEKEAHRSRMREILTWVQDTSPMLTPKIAWNQPMFTHHGTFIICLLYTSSAKIVTLGWSCRTEAGH